MKKNLVLLVSALVLLSSCGTYTESGATTGSWFGSIIGSAIGGIAGGPRGSDIGTLVGMASGAVVGAAIGSAADKAEQQKYEDYKAARQEARQRRNGSYNDNNAFDDSGYDATNSGDDRLYNFGEDFSSVENVNAPATLEIRHVRFLDASKDGVLTRGEEARMVFEIYNKSQNPVYRVQPSVAEMTGNKHIHISENIMVESIPAGKGIRYTASIKADNGLRNGEAVIRIGVLQGNKEIISQTRQYPIQTAKK